MKNDRGDLVLNLFAPKRQYRIPLYQRHYVWDRNNWDTLWTDIEAKFDCRRNSREPFSRHFTGTILTYQDRSKDNLLPPYQILDGQQRLTTFQIILCAIRDICLSKRYTIGSGSRLPPPDSLIKYQGSDKQYNKLCPKEGFDEKAFRTLTAPKKTQEELSGNHLIHRAYRYFKGRIQECVKEKFAEIDLLYEAVVLDFDMVQINLKDRRDLEKIFASLNATGRMLDEFDRLRMDLFLRAGKNEDRLYCNHWRHFDTERYWEKQGKSEIFLRHFLEAKVDPTCFQTQDGKEVKAFDVYLKQYRPMLKPHQGIEYEFRQLKKYSRVYQKMNDPDSDIGRRMTLYKEFEVDNMHPFILYIISEFSEFANSQDDSRCKFLLSDSDLELVFDILESYMIRRMLRWGRDHNYRSIDMVNKFFNSSMDEKSFSLAKFIEHMTNPRPERHQDKWSTDLEVNGALTEEWHDHVTKSIRYILYRIEVEMRGEKRTKIDFAEELRLEYVMPRRWEYSLSWQLPLEKGSDRCIPYDNIFSEEHKKNNRSWRKADPSEEGLIDQSYLYALNLAKARRKHQKSIGNLTLVDADIDTDEFADKKLYFEHFNLAINRVIYDSESWDAPQIEKRAEELIECFHKLWPSSEYFKERYLLKKYPVGSTVRGLIASIRNNHVLIRLEEGLEGWIPMSEMGWKVETIGNEIESVVLAISKRKGSVRVILSRKPFQPNLYEHLQNKYPIGAKITGRVIEVTTSGTLVKIDGGIKGKIQNFNLSWAKRKTIADEFLNEGDKIKAVVLEVNADAQYISLGLKQLQPNPWETLAQKYPVGTKIIRRIQSITNYGAFLDIEEGISGLLHNSELSWTKQNVTARELFTEDEQVEVVILKIDASKQRVSLGFKQLQPNLWDDGSVTQKYPVGTKIIRRIQSITNYGAFLDIEEGISGLLHNSELSWTKQNVTARELFTEDEQVEVVILKIDASKQQVALGFKQLQPNPWDEIPVLQKYSIGTKVRGRVMEITNYGALLEIEEGIKGLLHNSELSWTNAKVTAHELLNEGDEIKVVVLQVDASKQQMQLGYKQTQPDPWDEIPKKYRVGSHVHGQIVNTTKFGAFVEIEEGIEGLIHISELTDQKIEKPEEVVSIGEKLDVKVINISPKDRKIGLSLKAVTTVPLTAITYNGQKKLPQMVKPDILFACSVTAWKTLKDCIQVRDDVKRQLLSPIKSRKKILKVLDLLLSSARKKKIFSVAVTRVGHELYGTIENFNSDEIEMQVSGKMVTVYRHGLIEFTTMELHRGKVTEFKNNTGEGFIQSSGLPRIFVSISEVYGKNTMSITDQTVEFEICQTLNGLEARNVVIIQKLIK